MSEEEVVAGELVLTSAAAADAVEDTARRSGPEPEPACSDAESDDPLATRVAALGSAACDTPVTWRPLPLVGPPEVIEDVETERAVVLVAATAGLGSETVSAATVTDSVAGSAEETLTAELELVVTLVLAVEAEEPEAVPIDAWLGLGLAAE